MDSNQDCNDKFRRPQRKRKVNTSAKGAAANGIKGGELSMDREKQDTAGNTPMPQAVADSSSNYFVSINASIFECPHCPYSTSIAKDLSDHRTSDHKDLEVSFKCPECEYRPQNYHATACHVPKCKGAVVIVKEVGEYECEACDRRFDTKIGRGQHVKNAHPELRVIKEAQARERDILRKRLARAEARAGPPKMVWSDEEVKSLRTLEKRFAGEQFINKKIAEFLPSKTHKQISDKRRLLPKVNDEGEDPTFSSSAEKTSKRVKKKSKKSKRVTSKENGGNQKEDDNE